MLQTKYYSKTWPCSFQEVKMLNCTTLDDGRRPPTTILGYLSDSGYIKIHTKNKQIIHYRSTQRRALKTPTTKKKQIFKKIILYFASARFKLKITSKNC